MDIKKFSVVSVIEIALLSVTIALGSCDLLQDSHSVLFDQVNAARVEYEKANAEELQIIAKYNEAKAKSYAAEDEDMKFHSKETAENRSKALAKEIKLSRACGTALKNTVNKLNKYLALNGQAMK